MLGPIEGEGYWEVLSWCATPGVTERHRFITYEEAVAFRCRWSFGHHYIRQVGGSGFVTFSIGDEDNSGNIT